MLNISYTFFFVKLYFIFVTLNTKKGLSQNKKNKKHIYSFTKISLIQNSHS